MTTPNEALRTILPIAGWGDTQAADVVFTGGADPVLPTPFRIGAAGAATLAASGLAATELWQVRTGRRQQVTVDLRQATAALRSGNYLRLAGTDVSSERNTIMGFYPTRDGRWSYLHCNFPNHRTAALSVLGVAEDREAVARAVATWSAADLEEAIIAAKGAGGMARTQAEWAKHPQGAAVAALPLMEIIRIGDSAPEPLPAGDRPLSGIRVLDLTRVMAGPTCARTLAEHGADVLRITGAHLPSLGYQELDTGHGKLAANLDLRAPSNVDILRGLARDADVFSQGYRPGTLANRSLSPEELAAIRPGLVYVSLCAFGHTGPWASRRDARPILRAFAISEAPLPCAFNSRTWAASIEAGATLVDAGRLGLGDPLELALAAQVRLEFGEDAEHVQEALAGRGAGVDRLLGRLQRPPLKSLGSVNQCGKSALSSSLRLFGGCYEKHVDERRRTHCRSNAGFG